MKYFFLFVFLYPLFLKANNIHYLDTYLDEKYTTNTDSAQLSFLFKKAQHFSAHENLNLDSLRYFGSKYLQIVNKNEDSINLYRMYFFYAGTFKQLNKLDSAEYYAKKSFVSINKENNSREKANAGYLLATILIDKNQLEEAIKQILVNIKFAKHNDIKSYLFKNYELLAYVNYDENNTNLLYSYFKEKAFSFYTDSPTKVAYDKKRKIIEKIESKDNVDKDLKEFYEFIHLQNEELVNFKYQYLMEIGTAFLDAGVPQKALEIFLPLSTTKNNKNNEAEFHIYYRITSAYLQLNQFNKAKEWHKKALKGEKKVNVYYDYLYLLKNDAIIKEKEGDYFGALQTQKTAKYLQDSLSKKRQELNFFQISTYENLESLEDKVKSITYSNELQKNHIEKDKKIKQLLSLIVIMLISIVLLIAFLFRKTRKHNKWIYQQKTQLEVKTQQLNEANQIKDKLFSLISHELRSPAAELISILDLEESSLDQKEYQHYLKNIRAKAQNIYNTMDGLLTWSASQIQLQPTRLDKTDLKSKIDSLLSTKETKIRKKNISIINQLTPTHVLANEHQTTVVLRNILNNAIKFTPTEGFIRIYNIEKDNLSGIAIRDTGSGISEEKLSTLLRDIQISQSGTLGEKGNGVGLIICKELMEKQNGEISIYSDGENGTEVRILFQKAKNIG